MCLLYCYIGKLKYFFYNCSIKIEFFFIETGKFCQFSKISAAPGKNDFAIWGMENHD
jgi:hypothetical protein